MKSTMSQSKKNSICSEISLWKITFSLIGIKLSENQQNLTFFSPNATCLSEATNDLGVQFFFFLSIEPTVTQVLSPVTSSFNLYNPKKFT